MRWGSGQPRNSTSWPTTPGNSATSQKTLRTPRPCVDCEIASPRGCRRPAIRARRTTTIGLIGTPTMARRSQPHHARPLDRETWLLPGRVAAVDDNRGTSHVRRGRAREEHRQWANLGRLPGAAHRDIAYECLDHVRTTFIPLPVHVGHEEPRTDGIDRDAMRRPVHGRTAREMDDGGL